MGLKFNSYGNIKEVVLTFDYIRYVIIIPLFLIMTPIFILLFFKSNNIGTFMIYLISPIGLFPFLVFLLVFPLKTKLTSNQSDGSLNIIVRNAFFKKRVYNLKAKQIQELYARKERRVGPVSIILSENYHPNIRYSKNNEQLEIDLWPRMIHRAPGSGTCLLTKDELKNIADFLNINLKLV